MQVNYDDTTKWTLIVSATSMTRDGTGNPVIRLLQAMRELERIPEGEGLLGRAYLRRNKLHAVWLHDTAGATLLAARIHVAEAVADAELAFSASTQPVRVAHRWHNVAAGLGDAWFALRDHWLSGADAPWPDRLDLPDGSSAWLLRLSGRTLVLPGGPDPERGVEAEARTLVTDLDRMLDLAGVAGTMAAERAYRLVVLPARTQQIEPGLFLREGRGAAQAAAWSLVLAERFGNRVLELLELSATDIDRARVERSQERGWQRLVEQVRKELDAR